MARRIVTSTSALVLRGSELLLVALTVTRDLPVIRLLSVILLSLVATIKTSALVRAEVVARVPIAIAVVLLVRDGGRGVGPAR